MPHWEPSRRWEGQDVYVIGGGDSLRTFDWELLRGKNTIGCNSAFVLGPLLCKQVVFADFLWWDKIGSKGFQNYAHENVDWQERGRKGLSFYGGLVLGVNKKLHKYEHIHPSFLLTTEPANKKGLSKGPALCLNGNTGAAAINAALVQGAKRVFLLGFDMELGTTGKSNWHDLRYEKSKAAPLMRFRNVYRTIALEAPRVFPGTDIVQINERFGLVQCDTLGKAILKNDKTQDVFPREGVAEHFKEKTWT